MRQIFRYVFLAIAAVFLAAIVIQTFFAGLMLFGQEGGRSLHENTGYILHLAGAVLFLIAPALARAGARTILLGVVLAAVTFGQPFLALASSSVVAALHAVNALVMFTLSLVLSRRALMLVRSERQTT